MKPINVFDLVIRDWMNRRPDGKPFYFVQIGAHDGVNLDPIHSYVKAHGWTGLFVEPQPEVFERLKQNYTTDRWVVREHGETISLSPNPYWFLNAAVGRHDGEATLYRFKPGQKLPDHASQLASFNRQALEMNGHSYQGEIEALKVPAISVETLCQKYPMQKLDLLQIDAEGPDAWIIRKMLEFGVRPQIVHFESCWKSLDYYGLIPELEALGYGLCEVGVNMICYRQPENEAFKKEQANVGY